MRKYLLACAAAALMVAGTASAAAALTILSSVNGFVRDSFADGVPDSVNPVVIEIQKLDNTGNPEDRGVIEFDISGLSSPVTLATLNLLTVIDTIDPPWTVSVSGYAGDGVLGLDDFANTAGVTSFVIHTETSFSVDVTPFINSMITAGETFAGFNLRIASVPGFLVFSPNGTGPLPELSVDLPEPTTALLLACGLVGLGVRRRLH
jgi:hypothetical protein